MTRFAFLFILPICYAAVSELLSPRLLNQAEEVFFDRHKRQTDTCSFVAGAVGFRGYFPNSTVASASLSCPIGYCPCSDPSGADNMYVFQAQLYANTSRASHPQFTVQCANMSNFCLCNSAGYCYQPMGSLTDVGLYGYCDSSSGTAVCAVYAVMSCTTPSGGLLRTSGSVNRTCASQSVGGVQQNFGTTSPFLQVASVGCGGCPNPSTDSCGPYTVPYPQ